MKWASAISHQTALGEAVAECAKLIQVQLASPGASCEPHLVFVFASPHYYNGRGEVPAAIQAQFPEALVFGCTGAGIIGAGHEVEGNSALSMTAAHLPGVAITPFRVDAASLPSPDAPPETWQALARVQPGDQPHFVVLSDPFAFDIDALLQGLDFAFPGAAKIGGVASGAEHPGENVLYAGNKSYDSGAVGIALSGDVVVDTVVAQGCRPIGRALRVTKAERNLLVELDEQPAFQVLQDLYQSLDGREQRLIQGNLFLGLAPAWNLGIGGPGFGSVLASAELPTQHDQSTEFLIRNVIGADAERGIVSIGALLEEGQTVQFHVRDAETSAQDLRDALRTYTARARGMPVEGALLFSCIGRGRGLYGRSDHDTGLFREIVGDRPIGGFFCNGEIGPVGGVTYLHGYTSSFGIFRSRTTPD